MADGIGEKNAVLPWTDERVNLLRKLWLDGLSASRIATELAGGVTRNAVIGKVHRLGLSGRAKVQPVVPAAPTRDRPATKTPAQAARTPMQQRPLGGSIASAGGSAAFPVSGNLALAGAPQALALSKAQHGGDNVVSINQTVTIMDLRESMCRWPVGDPSSSEFRYCGGKVPIGGGPYCVSHSRMAYQPMQDRRQRKTA